ncbi:hypothetical protein B296_00001117 [Ensete ventricosum]|uniref:Uncharacterized protein n=1 Tax=Ensete ventricosum TaxID=4639 RepID=A0A426ZP12_ENSVE|nr:hypothetical protein B296_00001117 [Ensete ventricosum]
MILSLLPPQRKKRAHVRDAWLGRTGRLRCTAQDPPSRANMLEENLWCLLSRCGLPPCLLGGHCWFRSVCASSPAVISAQRWSSVGWEEPSGPGREVGYLRGGVGSCRGFYSKCFEASIPEVLTAHVAYHVVVLRCSLRGPCCEARDVLPAIGERRSCPPYPCQVDRTTADPLMLVSGQLQSCRVDHVVGLAISVGSAQVELPKQVVDCYKESTGFKEGLKRMGQVTYEYGYRVALACFHALHPDSEVEEDPFTIHPEDDLVPMKRQQAFDN